MSSIGYQDTLSQVLHANVEYIGGHMVSFLIGVVIMILFILAVTVVCGSKISKDRNKKLL